MGGLNTTAPTCCIILALASARFPGPVPSPDIMVAPVFFKRSPIFAERPETTLLVVFCQTYPNHGGRGVLWTDTCDGKDSEHRLCDRFVREEFNKAVSANAITDPIDQTTTTTGERPR